MDDPTPDAGVSWDTLSRDYPATFGGEVGSGFYREKWIAHYRQHVEIFGRPPLLQHAYRWARPLELVARLLAYGLVPQEVRICVFRPDKNRHQIYAVLSQGNGQPADALLHLFAPMMPIAGASILANVRAHAEKLCGELTDTSPAPEPNSICPDLCPADKFVKWPKPEEIESVLSESPQPAFTKLVEYPATSAGHIGFLEWVGIELREQAHRVRMGDRAHDLIAKQLKHGVQWEQASLRIAALPELPNGIKAKLAKILRRELAVGTVETIAERFTNAVEELREVWEDSRDTAMSSQQPTDKALEQGEAPASQRPPAAPFVPSPAPRPDILLVTVNENETRAVYDGFRAATNAPATTVPLDGRVYRNLGAINGTTVYHAISEMGSGGVGAMQQTVDKAIRALDPGAVIAVGVAFGVNDTKQAVGEILLSRQLRPYDVQRIGQNIILRGDKPHATARLINHFIGFAQTTWGGAKVRPGVILTGDKLIDNIDYRDALLAIEGEAVGGEMEGAGLYVPCNEHKVDWIVIKAICDWADGDKSKNKAARQKKAAKNAMQFVIEALQNAPLKRRK